MSTPNNEGTVVVETVEQPVEAVETPTPVAETPAPVVETPAPVVEDIVYEYQPVDDLGRPLGAKQVFKGKTQQEILEKVAKAHQESIKLTRELKKNLRLGNLEQEDIPEEAARYTDNEDDFAPRDLTAEERYSLSRDLLDPEKCDEAAERLLEAKFGKPEVFRNKIKQQNELLEQLQAKYESDIFLRNTPDYYPCKDNYETLTNWMLKNRLKPVYQNFKLAFETLRAVGLLLEAPIVREEVPPVTPTTPVVAPVAETVQPPVNSQPGPDDTSRITSEQPQSQQKRPAKVATGLNNSNTSSVGASPTQSTKLSVADIERMPSEVYKQKLKDPAFRKLAEEAFAEATKPKRI